MFKPKRFISEISLSERNWTQKHFIRLFKSLTQNFILDLFFICRQWLNSELPYFYRNVCPQKWFEVSERAHDAYLNEVYIFCGNESLVNNFSAFLQSRYDKIWFRKGKITTEFVFEITSKQVLFSRLWFMFYCELMLCFTFFLFQIKNYSGWYLSESQIILE